MAVFWPPEVVSQPVIRKTKQITGTIALMRVMIIFSSRCSLEVAQMYVASRPFTGYYPFATTDAWQRSAKFPAAHDTS